MKSPWEKLQLSRAAARVVRYHTLPTVHHQTVGEHTFNVLNLILLVEPEASAQLLRAAIDHDKSEAITGDTPSTAKWAHPDIEQQLKIAEARIVAEFELHTILSDYEKQVLKFCDLMELVVFSLEEYESGNKKMIRVARRGINAINRRHIHDVTSQALWVYGLTAHRVTNAERDLRDANQDDLIYDRLFEGE